MESDSTPAGQEDGRGIPPGLLEVLAGLDPQALQSIAELLVLRLEFPAWAVWLPHGGRPWTAVRAASARAPGPEVLLIWVRAGTPAEFGACMRRADAGLSPG